MAIRLVKGQPMAGIGLTWRANVLVVRSGLRDSCHAFTSKDAEDAQGCATPGDGEVTMGTYRSMDREAASISIVGADGPRPHWWAPLAQS